MKRANVGNWPVFPPDYSLETSTVSGLCYSATVRKRNQIMKTFLLALLVLTTTVSAHSQGTVLFINIGPGFNAPVYGSDGVTALSGSQFMAELLGGPSVNNLASIAATGFLTGAQGGYFNGGTQTINSVAPQATAWVGVRVWNTASGSSFLQAQASGLPNSWWQSPVFSIVTGGGIINPAAPAPLTGFGTSPVFLNSVPEPSTIALAALGAAVVSFRFLRRGGSAVSKPLSRHCFCIPSQNR